MVEAKEKSEAATKKTAAPAKKGVKAKLLGKKEKAEATKATPQAAPVRDPYEILKFVLMTEKAVRQIELQNKLVFIVDRKAKRTEIRSAAEIAFNSPVRSVQTLVDQTGRKKASIRFRNAGAAGDIAVKLGII